MCPAGQCPIPRGGLGCGSRGHSRCSQLSPSQPGRQWHEPRTWSQPAAFLHLHTWWQSIPKNPSGQAGNAKHSFLAQFFCTNSTSSFYGCLRTEVPPRVKPAQFCHSASWKNVTLYTSNRFLQRKTGLRILKSHKTSERMELGSHKLFLVPLKWTEEIIQHNTRLQGHPC